MAGRGPKARQVVMTAEERALFEKAMADVKPLQGGGTPDIDVPNMPVEEDFETPDWMKAAAPGSARIAHPALEEKTIETRGDSPAPREGFDRKTRRSLTKGREAIDRTIDLHGLNQETAFAVLVRTIERAVARDMKTVLVITGKGGKRFQQLGDAPAAARTRADFESGTGVLKRMVPIWLGGDALRSLVESFAPASPGHGGEGALYVRLRRRRKREAE